MTKNIIFGSILIIIILSISIMVLSLYNLRTAGIKSAIHNAESISEVIKGGLTSYMVDENMDKADTFLQSISNMQNINKIWLVRSEFLNKQFSKESYKTPRDEIDKEVISTGELKYKINETITSTTVRISIPYNAVSNRGVDCLKCHQVKQGSTLGAISLEIDITTLKQIGIESIYIIMGIVLISIFFFLLFTKRLLSPYLALYNDFRNNIDESLIGKFSKIHPSPNLSKEMIQITEDFNKLIKQFKETSIGIDEKLQGFIGYKTLKKSNNPLNDSQEIIDNLSNLFQFKKQIELDNTKEEIYSRLSQVFLNKFNIKNFSFIEINMLSHKMENILNIGEGLYCKDGISENPEECRCARTKNDIMSIDFHNSCPFFEKKDKFYYCINIDIAKNVYLIVNFVCDTKEELDILKEKIIFLKNYLSESSPALEVKLLMNVLKESTFIDGLTGLYNRKFLEESSKKLIPQALREKTKIGVLMLDMDHFKAVNDEYGHDIGDKVLIELARILNETLRESDLIIRYGGEEFIVLLVGVKSENDALDVANKIGENVRNNEINVYAGNKLRKTISCGLSMFPDDASSFETVIKNADIALYEAKDSGRDKVIRFKDDQVTSVDLF